MRTLITLFTGLIAVVWCFSQQPPPLKPDNKPPVLVAGKGEAKVKDNEPRYTPFTAVQIAATDAAALVALHDPNIDPSYVVYLSLHNIPKAQRKLYKATADYVVNSLNAQLRPIVRTAFLPVGDDPLVVRINLKDYGISIQAWIDLVTKGSGQVPLPEPYFYINNAIQEPIYTTESYQEPTNRQVGWYPDGRPAYQTFYVTKQRQKVTGHKKINRIIPAPWLSIEPDPKSRGSTIATLIKSTRNTYPIVRADWFITYASWAPAYYELIGLQLKPNPVNDTDAVNRPKVFLEKDFQDLLGFNRAAAERDILGAVVDTKLVALHNRIIQRFNLATGITGNDWWQSQDTDLGINDEDYLNQLINFNRPKIKAQEIIASGRNGLHQYALTDNKGRILDVAVANIAVHSTQLDTKFTDKQVYAGRNCILCHANGQLPLEDKVRKIAQKKIALFITDNVKDPDAARRIQDAFSPDTKLVIDLDNARFQAAVKVSTGGLSGREISAAFESIVYTYYYEAVTIDKAAWEVGLTTPALLAILKEGINLDYTLTALLQEPPVDVSRLPWENQGFNVLMNYLIGYVPKK